MCDGINIKLMRHASTNASFKRVAFIVNGSVHWADTSPVSGPVPRRDSRKAKMKTGPFMNISLPGNTIKRLGTLNTKLAII